MSDPNTTENPEPVGSSELLARTFVATIFLVAGVGCVAFAVHYRMAGDTGNALLGMAGGICGCFAAMGISCAR